jgi:hypothetical protein
VVEHAERHVELLAALDVSEERRQRRVHRERDRCPPGELAEPAGPVVIHPEPALEVDLAGGVAAVEQDRDRLVGGVVRRHARRPEADLTHCPPR